jgi:hypothetical protein
MTKFCAASTAAATAVLIATAPRPAPSQEVVLVPVDVKAVAQGYRTSELTGEEVLNDAKEEIGEIDDFVIGGDTEAPDIFAVLEVGGFLGLGGYLVAVPIENLGLDDPSGEIVLKGATQEALKELPELEYGS